MNIKNETINTLLAGGTELTKKMDNLLGVSNIVNSLNIKKRGLPLWKIHRRQLKENATIKK